MNEVEQFYNDQAREEWGRLDRHRTEFAVTLKALNEYLPVPPRSILDIGGGPGRYSLELARRGYAVTLADLSEESLRLAREKAKEARVSLAACIHANALNLSSFEASSYEAVLLMGPLYHLLTTEHRVRAVKEALRVLRPGGKLFAAFITRFAPFREAASNRPEWVVENQDYALGMLETGVHDKSEKFPRAYFAHPEEVVPLMEGCGLRTLQLIGCEGIVAGHEEKVNELSGDAWVAWVDLNYELGKEPSLHGAADHLLYVGMKSGYGEV